MKMEMCLYIIDMLSLSDKWRYTLYTTFVFLIIANPYAYKMVQKLLGRVVKIASSDGCPTCAGLLVHAIIFTLILRWIMNLDI